MLALHPSQGAVTAKHSASRTRQVRHTRNRCRIAQASHFDADWSLAAAKPERVITFVTSEGLVNLSDSRGLFQGLTAYHQQPRSPTTRQQLPTVEEQGICIGQTFLVAASNGRDPSRRVHVLGFCRSVQLVSEAVEDTVLSAGGEVWQRDTQLAGLGERLVMTVAMPYLWGLPPAFDTLRHAILQGGGIVHKVSKQWQLM